MLHYKWGFPRWRQEYTRMWWYSHSNPWRLRSSKVRLLTTFPRVSSYSSCSGAKWKIFSHQLIIVLIHTSVRLRVAPLTLSPSCVTRKKTARKENGRAKSWWRKPRFSSPGFRAAIFSSRFIYGHARRTTRTLVINIWFYFGLWVVRRGNHTISPCVQCKVKYGGHTNISRDQTKQTKKN